MTDIGTAAAALEDARAVRARLAQKLRCPWYMHALFGTMYGALVAAQGGPTQVVFAVEGLVVLSGVGMFLWTRRRLGFFVNGYRRGRTRRVVAALIVAFLVAMSLAAWAKAVFNLAWPALVLGALMFVVGTYASVAWQKTYRQELKAELGPMA